MMGDILEEDEGRRDLANDAGDMRPEEGWLFWPKAGTAMSRRCFFPSSASFALENFTVQRAV